MIYPTVRVSHILRQITCLILSQVDSSDIIGARAHQAVYNLLNLRALPGYEAMQGQKGILVLSPESIFTFLHTRSKVTASLLLGHSEQGMLYSTLRRLCVERGFFTCTSAFRRDCVGLRAMVRSKVRTCLATNSETPCA